MIGKQAYLLYKDRQILQPRSAFHMAKVLFVRPGILSKVLAGVLPYFSPTFHPWDDDNRHVIHVWKRAYEKSNDAQQAYQALRDHCQYATERARHPIPQTASAQA
ncbi:metal-dependent hydrolase [Paraperlucidibaca sp.]|uniref:metal-dependent hydrolase n=1 Tax=Paraperlucidibaca sp. TaxID=2708021 RepID=UPI0030F3F567